MTWMTMLLAIGATVRLTRLLTLDVITFPIRDWLAARTQDASTKDKISLRVRLLAFVEEMVTCTWCLSIWIGVPVVAVAWSYGETGWFVVPALMLTASLVTGMILAKKE